MQIGTGLFTCQKHPDDDRQRSDIYADVLDLGRTIDDVGLDSAWVSEHHFQEDGYLSATMPALGALASVTSDVEIGPCIALAPLYDGVRLAEDAATVDLLSDGRLTVGLSIGSNPSEFHHFGVPREERVPRLEDQVNLLRSAWSEGPLEYRSEFHDPSPDVTVTPKPESDVPIMLGGGAKPAVRRAARVADAWCAPSKFSIPGLRKRVEDIRSLRAEEGYDGEFDIYIIQHGWVGENRDNAWEAMRDGYYYIQRRYAEIFGDEPVTELSAERRAELKERAIFGNPDQVVEELSEYRDALGDDIHFIFRTYYPGTDHEATKECIQRLGDEVAPRL